MKYLYSIALLGAIVLLTFGTCCVPVDNSNSSSSYNVYDGIVEANVEFDDVTADASIARNFYFLIDVSGSMRHGCSGKSKIEGAKESLLTFIQDVPDDVNIGLSLFGTQEDVTEVIELGPNNKNNFIAAVSELSPSGSTPLGLATRMGTDALIAQYKKQLGYGEYRLIIVTDGSADSLSAFERSLKNALKYPWIGIYGIGLCMDRSHDLKDYSLSYADADDYDQLKSALKETLAETEVFDVSDFENLNQ